MKSKLKVLNVYRTYFPDPPGGLQEAIRQICMATQNQGVENVIFTLSPHPVPKILRRAEARVVRRRSWAAPASCDLGSLEAIAEFRRLAREADVVHYFFPWPFADLLHALACPAGKPTVLTYVSDIVRQRWLGTIYAPLMWHTLHNADVVVANCPGYVRSSPVLSTPEIAKKTVIIPLGIDENSYPREGDPGILPRLGIMANEPYFLFLGVLRYYKGLHTLIRAASSVNARIVIAGSGPEGEALRMQANQALAGNVVFAGQITDAEKMTLLHGCRALVLPSHLRSEAYGMVLVEAAMFGKPMISCEIGTGTSFVNTDGETGFVVPPEQPERLAQAMNRLLVDASLCVHLGAAARQRYEMHFSGDALGRSYAALYRKLLAYDF